jgi:hypothetical protein
MVDKRLYFDRTHKRLLYMYMYSADLTRRQWLKLRTYEARMGNTDGIR